MVMLLFRSVYQPALSYLSESVLSPVSLPGVIKGMPVPPGSEHSVEMCRQAGLLVPAMCATTAAGGVLRATLSFLKSLSFSASF